MRSLIVSSIILMTACTKPVYEGSRLAKTEAALLTERGALVIHSINDQTKLPLVLWGNYELIPGEYKLVVGLDRTSYITGSNAIMSFKATAGHKYIADFTLLPNNRWITKVVDVDTKEIVSGEVRFVRKE